MEVHHDVDNLAVWRRPLVALRRVPCRLKRPEIEDRRVHLIVEVATAVLRPLALQVPRRDRDLIRSRAHSRAVVGPLGIVTDVVVRPRRGIRRRLHARLRGKLLLLAIIVVRDLGSRLLAEGWAEQGALAETALPGEV